MSMVWALILFIVLLIISVWLAICLWTSAVISKAQDETREDG